jgi:hypothetical protein
MSGPLDERVRDRLVAETHGNPLALLELPRGVAPAELAGVPGLPGAPGLPGLPGRIEDNFRRRLEVLPAAAQRLMLVAAAEPAGEPALVWRAAQRLGTEAGAVAPAADGGLLAIGERATFRHPLVRSAAYRAASPAERRAAPRRGGLTAAAAFPDRGRADPRPGAAGGAGAGRGAGQVPGRRVRRRPGTAGHRGGRAAGPAPPRPRRPAARPDRVRLQPRQRRTPAAAEGSP